MIHPLWKKINSLAIGFKVKKGFKKSSLLWVKCLALKHCVLISETTHLNISKSDCFLENIEITSNTPNVTFQSPADSADIWKTNIENWFLAWFLGCIHSGWILVNCVGQTSWKTTISFKEHFCSSLPITMTLKNKIKIKNIST